MRATRRDWLLRWLVLATIAVTVVSMLASLVDVSHIGAGHDVDGARRWLGLIWLVLIVVAAARATTHVQHLRRQLDLRDDRIEGVAVTSHDWLWEATPDLVATYCSPGAAELTGRRPEDLVGHYLGEFVVGEDQPRMAAELAAAVAERRGWQDVELQWVHADGHLVRLQGSAVSVLDRRGRLVGFRGVRRSRPLREPTARLARTRARVAELIENDGLAIALQPITSLSTGCCVGVEALSRFADGTPPDQWFSEAAAAGVGLELELLAVRTALAALPHLPPPVFMSINASPSLIRDPRLAAILDQPDVPLHRIVLELTEHVQVGRYDDISAVLGPLRQRGLRLAIDDTGAGYASFSHVLALRPDMIKIDRSIITDIGTDAARRALVTAIVLLALELGADVTAEGVETAAELRVLASLGVDHAQGYFLARPVGDPATWRAWASRAWPTGTLLTSARPETLSPRDLASSPQADQP